MHTPIPPSAVHAECEPAQCIEPLRLQVLPTPHRQHDVAKGEELLVLGAQEGLAFEEGDDRSKQIRPPAHDVHQRGVRRAPVIGSDRAAAKPLEQEVEDLSPFGVLAYVELRHQLKSSLGARVPLQRYMERAFAIDEASEIRIQPFLLIVRTGQIVTVHVANPTKRV